MNFDDFKNYKNANEIGDDGILIAAVNAYQYLYDKFIPSGMYYEIARNVGGYRGNITDHVKMLDILDLEYEFLYGFSNNMETQEMPVEVSVLDNRLGLHSALILEYNEYVDAVQIINLRSHTNKKGWILVDDLFVLLKDFDEHHKTPFRHIRKKNEY